MDDDLGVERGMVEGDQHHRSPCRKLSHTTRFRHTNLSRRYTLQTRFEQQNTNLRPLTWMFLSKSNVAILTIPITMVFLNSALTRGVSRDLSRR